MKNLKPQIIAVEALELLLSPEGRKALFVVNKDSANRTLFEENLPTTSLKLIGLNRQTQLAHDDETSLRQAEVRKILSNSAGREFFLSYFSSNSVERELRSHHLNLIGNSWKQQGRFEDKIIFFKMLQKYHLPTPEGFILNSSKDQGVQGLNGKWVVQTPWTPSADVLGPGTYLVSGESEAKKLIKRLKGERQLLFRRFTRGLTVGVTIVVGKSRLVFSAPRFQVSNPFKGGDYLIGTQWLPTRALSALQVSAINETLQDLGSCLINEGFHGLANIDLILTSDQALILECNCRSTTSSYLLAHTPELFHGRSYLAELFRTFRKGDPSFNAPYLPKNSFQGTSLEIDPLVRVDNLEGKRLSKHETPDGVYRFSEKTGSLIRISKSLNDFSSKGRILLTCPAPTGVKFNRDWSLGTALTNFPIFNLPIFATPSFTMHRKGAPRTELGRIGIKNPKILSAIGRAIESSWLNK